MPATRVTVKKEEIEDGETGRREEQGSWRRETFKQDAALAAQSDTSLQSPDPAHPPMQPPQTAKGGGARRAKSGSRAEIA